MVKSLTTEWSCPNCGSDDPHHAITFYDEIEVDVTCESVYITPTDGGDGFVFEHEDFEEIIEHYQSADRGSE